MKIRQLSMRNIGPFIESDMRFSDEDEEEKPSPVVLITGENGTGKSIILDAIRGMFGPKYGKLTRNIRRKKAEEKSHIRMILESDGKELCLNSHEIRENDILPGPRAGDHYELMNMPENVQKGGACPHLLGYAGLLNPAAIRAGFSNPA